MRRVVITGMGIWSCLGTSLEEVSDSLKNGKSGIGVEEIRKEFGYRSPLTGIVPIPELKDKLLDFADTFLPGGSFIWGARVTGNPTDPATIERNAVLKDFYYDYVRDYYKTH